MTNNSTEAPASPTPFDISVPLHIQIILTILSATIILLASVGNTLVIYIVFTVNRMRNSTNILIANMAVADLLMTIDIPYVLKWMYVWDRWFGTFMGAVLCKFFHSSQAGSLAASVFSLVAISFDRSFAILFPMKTIMTGKVVRIAIAMTWIGALALMIPLTLATKNTRLEGTEFMICNEHWTSMSREVYMTVFFTTAYIIPLSSIATVYCLAGLRLWRRKLPGNHNPTAQKRAQSSSRRATVMLITVVVIFALSWLLFQAREMILVYNPTLLYTLPIEVDLVLPWVGFSNSAVNPILYVIFSENYRREFHRILCRRPSRKDRFRVDPDKCSATRSGISLEPTGSCEVVCEQEVSCEFDTRL